MARGNFRGRFNRGKGKNRGGYSGGQNQDGGGSFRGGQRGRGYFQGRDRIDFGRRDSRQEFLTQERQSEEDVGITEYISKLEGFSGIIKARFSDFHVNEINREDQVAKLTDVSIPKEFVEGKCTACIVCYMHVICKNINI